MKRTIHSLEELQQFAQEFARNLKPLENRATIVALSGDLGAGKTTFTQMLARELGVTETVSSPTFVIMKKYPTSVGLFETLVHIDAYRLNGGSELDKLRFQDEVANPHNLILIEWPELVGDALPENIIRIQIIWIDETTREIKMATE